MKFNLNDFYTFLIELAFSLLFLIIFSSIHYSLNNVKKVRDGLAKNKVGRFFYFFVFGAAAASLSFVLSQLCAKTLGTVIGLPLTILSLIFTMSFFYGISVQVGAIIPSFVWLFLTYYGPSINPWELIARVMVLAIFVFVSLALWLMKQKKTIYFIFGNLIVIGLTILLISTINDDKFMYHTFETLISLLLALMFLGIIKYINRIFTNIINIAINSVYADKYFLVPESFEPNFNYYVTQNKINQALVILFEITESNNSKQYQMLLDEIYKKFNKEEYKPLFFKNEYNKYGVVLSGKSFFINDLEQCFKGNLYTDRLEKDNLFYLQNILKSIPLKYKQDEEKFNFNLKAYVSVYGVHSYDINELINNNMFMINNEDLSNSNVAKMFHSNMTEHITSDAIDYATLQQNINLDEITISLELIQMNDSKKRYVLPRVYWLNKMLASHTSIINKFPSKIGNTLLRNLAIKSIEQYTLSEYFGKYDLIVYYPWEELNTLFYSCNNAFQKIRLFGVDPKNIIFCFDATNVKVWPKNVLKHFDEYDENGFKYIILNINDSSILKSNKPLFVTYGKNLLSNSRKRDKANQQSKKHKINVLSI